MNIINAKYQKDLSNKNTSIEAVIDDVKISVPLDPANRHYAEILKQVADGTITIKDAE